MGMMKLRIVLSLGIILQFAFLCTAAPTATVAKVTQAATQPPAPATTQPPTPAPRQPRAPTANAPTKPSPSQPPASNIEPRVNDNVKATAEPIEIGKISGVLYLTHDDKFLLEFPRNELPLNASYPHDTKPTEPPTTDHLVWGSWNPYYFGWVVALIIGASFIILAALTITCLKKFKKNNTYSPGAKTKEDTQQQQQLL